MRKPQIRTVWSVPRGHRETRDVNPGSVIPQPTFLTSVLWYNDKPSWEHCGGPSSFWCSLFSSLQDTNLTAHLPMLNPDLLNICGKVHWTDVGLCFTVFFPDINYFKIVYPRTPPHRVSQVSKVTSSICSRLGGWPLIFHAELVQIPQNMSLRWLQLYPTWRSRC